MVACLPFKNVVYRLFARRICEMFHLGHCMFFIVWTIMLYCCPPVLEQPILFHQDVGLPPKSGRPHRRGSSAERWDIHQAWPRSVFLQSPTAPRVHLHPPNIGRQGLEQAVQRGETGDTNKTVASETEDSLKFSGLFGSLTGGCALPRRFQQNPAGAF